MWEESIHRINYINQLFRTIKVIVCFCFLIYLIVQSVSSYPGAYSVTGLTCNFLKTPSSSCTTHLSTTSWQAPCLLGLVFRKQMYYSVFVLNSSPLQYIIAKTPSKEINQPSCIILLWLFVVA